MADMQLADQLTLIETMTNVELRAELKRHGRPISGNKKDLLARLRTALQQEYERNVQASNVSQAPLNTSSVSDAHHDLSTAPSDLSMDDQHLSDNNGSIPEAVRPIIRIPRQLTLSSSEEHQPLPAVRTAEIHQTPHVSPLPEKTQRASANGAAVTSPSVENHKGAASRGSLANEQSLTSTAVTMDASTEINSSVSSRTQEERKDVERLGKDAHAPTDGDSRAKSVSVTREMPAAGQQLHSSPSKIVEPVKQRINPAAVAEQAATASVVSGSKKEQTQGVDPSSGSHSSGDQEVASKKPDKTERTENEESRKIAVHQHAATPSQTPSPVKGQNKPASNRINLSSDILKTLIPDIGLAPELNIDEDLDESRNEPMLETTNGNDLLLTDSMTIGDLVDQKQHRHRTVVMDMGVDSSSLNDDLLAGKRTPARVLSVPSRTLIDGKTNALIVDEPIRIKEATVAQETPTRILHIRGLTRPFTLLQLKELFRRYGTIVDDAFWLENIKSQCLVTYDTLEEAQVAREAIDGCRWPSNNPKTLCARFARQEEFDFSKSHDLSPDQMTIDALNPRAHDLLKTNKATHAADESKSNGKTNRREVREWDREKLSNEQPTGFLISDEEPKKPDEASVKGLDDYFRKTAAKPTLYWLPLTDEQVAERALKREQRNAERDEKVRAATNRKDSGNRRRSSTSREKRKHSSSPAKRDSKRQ